MDAIDVTFKNFLGNKYGYTNKSIGSYVYRCQIFPLDNTSNIIVDVAVKYKTAAFAAAIGKLLIEGANALNKPSKEFSTELNPNEFQ